MFKYSGGKKRFLTPILAFCRHRLVSRISLYSECSLLSRNYQHFPTGCTCTVSTSSELYVSARWTRCVNFFILGSNDKVVSTCMCASDASKRFKKRFSGMSKSFFSTAVCPLGPHSLQIRSICSSLFFYFFAVSQQSGLSMPARDSFDAMTLPTVFVSNHGIIIGDMSKAFVCKAMGRKKKKSPAPCGCLSQSDATKHGRSVECAAVVEDARVVVSLCVNRTQFPFGPALNLCVGAPDSLQVRLMLELMYSARLPALAFFHPHRKVA